MALKRMMRKSILDARHGQEFQKGASNGRMNVKVGSGAQPPDGSASYMHVATF